jgi:hypothetical protein
MGGVSDSIDIGFLIIFWFPWRAWRLGGQFEI